MATSTPAPTWAGARPETQLQSALIGSAHDYRIEWDATAVRYYVDGSLVATHAANFGATQMEPIASDFTAGGPGVSVDWLHMSPYPGSGSFTSRVLDAGQSAAWGALSWAADTPAGTSVALSVRTGNTPTPDGSWSSFTPISANGGDIPGNSRYLQYQADLSSNDAGKTPVLSQVSASYTQAATPPDPPQITATDPASPANNNNPEVKGTLGAGNPQTVKLFTNGSCQGTAAASGSAAEFTDAGITVSVPDDHTTTISATAVDAASNESSCSNSFDYTEDSTAPETQIDSGPSGTTNDASPSFTFSSPDNSASFQCRLDSNNAADWASCSSPKAYSSLADGTHTLEVRAVDTAGNPDPTPASAHLHRRHQRPRDPDRLRPLGDHQRRQPELHLLLARQLGELPVPPRLQ